MPLTDESQETEVTAAEAADILGKDRREVPRMVARGDLVPTRKLPGATGAYLFRRADVEAIASARRDTENVPAVAS